MSNSFNNLDLSKLNSSVVNSSNFMEEARRKAEKRQAVIAGRYDAEDTFEYLVRKINDFEEKLLPEEEVGMHVANFGLASAIHIRTISFRNPNLMEFGGLNQEGERVVLVQHLSQLNFVLSALKPIEEAAHRMGFEITK